MEPIILLSANPALLEQELGRYAKTVTVEAEYGSVVVEGSELTLAHHGDRAGNPAPCLRENAVVPCDAIGLSHMDLDAFGGLLSVLGRKPEAPAFWELAAFVDVHGPHKLSEANAPAEAVRALYAVWAYNQANRNDFPHPQRDGVMEYPHDAIRRYEDALRRILDGDEELLLAGDRLREETENLNSSSFVEEEAGVVVRGSDQFTNRLYNTPDGIEGKAVVALSTRTHGITVSLADPVEGFSVGAFLQDLFGPEAGGRDTIGGTPRGQFMRLADLLRTAEELRKRLNG